MSSSIPAFYHAARVNLWVEDPLTRDYLSAVWPDAPFHYLIAGGKEGARAMAMRAQAERVSLSVFAIVDRDLGTDNEVRWSDPGWTAVVYRPRVLEVENFLLDEASLAQAAGNAKALPAAELHRLLLARAQHLTWWMTCKRVLAELNAIRNGPFPPDQSAHPDATGGGVSSEAQAVALLRDCAWATTTLAELGRELADAALRQRVQRAHQEVQSWLTGEDWRDRFSGKELFDWVYGQVRDGARGRRAATREALAAEVGSIQRRDGRVPPSLVALEASIRRRAGV